RTAEIFSTCSRQHRAAECGYVERDLTGGLTGIQQVWDVVRPRNATDFRGRLHDAIIGRHMRERDQPSMAGYEPVQRFAVDAAISRIRYENCLDAHALFRMAETDHVRIILSLRG